MVEGRGVVDARADLVADLQPEDLPRFLKSLEASFHFEVEEIAEAVRSRSSFNVVHLATFVKVDVFLLQGGVFARQEMARRQRISVAGTDLELDVATAEDTVLQKLRWFELGGQVSEQQWLDVLGVLKVQGDRLDQPYLERWADILGVTELLARASEEAGWTIAPDSQLS